MTCQFVLFHFSVNFHVVNDGNVNFSERKKFSSSKLEELKSCVIDLPELKEVNNLCIYATGSYARLEACSHSDLDLFFISDGKFPKIDKTLIDAALIKLSRDQGISDFSGDGKYLEIHEINRITEELGGQSDDYENLFTARLLLILESHPLFNSANYDRFIGKIIDSYYADFEKHESDFKPSFLINDIIRYWKTITLNYENKRIKDDNEAKMRVNNFKLKFSRKLMCFSFIIKLLSIKETVKKGTVLDIVKQTPIERIKSLEGSGVQGLVDRTLEKYDWFLIKTSSKKKDLISWFDKKKNRDESLSKSEEFGELLFELLTKVDKKNHLKYLVI